MIIGTPKEIKDKENRVALIPSVVESLIKKGHDVLIEAGAGAGAGFSDEEYLETGAKVVSSAKDIFANAEMIVKVKEPQPSEYAFLRKNQILFTYLHLASDKEQTQALLKSGAICIAYETVTNENGNLPLLAPMSAIAGRMAILEAAVISQKHHGGSGILISGMPGVLPSKVVIIGGGTVGINAAHIAHGLNADVTVLDCDVTSLEKVDKLFGGQVKTMFSNKCNLTSILKTADIVVGAVLVMGASAPKIITRDMVKIMKKGSVIIDVAIDQGGCCESSRPTTHSSPTYEIDGVVHYCVTNMPGAYARTSTIALSNSVAVYVEKIADLGIIQALKQDRHLQSGLNIFDGKVTLRPLANDQNLEYHEPVLLLKISSMGSQDQSN